MSNDDSLDRRTFVKSTAIAVAGATSLAGCGGGGASTDDGGTESRADESDEGTPPTFDGWMDAVENYDGVADETGTDRVTVAVGASGNGENYAYDPPAVRISTGTTVVWEWTGKGQQHNVVEEGGAFESDLTAEVGFTFEHEFTASGTYPYFCTPHKVLGMKGIVVVE